MGMTYNAVIIGGGAAGMMCALHLAERGIGNVLLLERNDRLGRKLSVTGNGQGNVANENLSVDRYFGSGRDRVAAVLGRYGEQWLLRELTALGGLFSADETGRVYPTSRQASAVTDLFRFALEKSGVEIRLGKKAVAAEKRADGFLIRTEEGELSCCMLVLACGGMASPHFGSDGGGYALARAFGHTVTPLSPSLVRLRTEQGFIRGLKGVRCDCTVGIVRADGKQRSCFADARTRGDVLFTDSGVSGDAIFRISAFVREGDELTINFLPDIGGADLIAALRTKAERYPQMCAEDLLRGIVHSSVGKAALRRCNIALGERAEDVVQKLPYLAGTLQFFTVKVTGTDGFANAQVTKGGVFMEELTERLESKKAKGLFIVGELCDVDGECGGYNLQWAFSSGACAADTIAEALCG